MSENTTPDPGKITVALILAGIALVGFIAFFSFSKSYIKNNFQELLEENEINEVTIESVKMSPFVMFGGRNSIDLIAHKQDKPWNQHRIEATVIGIPMISEMFIEISGEQMLQLQVFVGDF